MYKNSFNSNFVIVLFSFSRLYLSVNSAASFKIWLCSVLSVTFNIRRFISLFIFSIAVISALNVWYSVKKFVYNVLYWTNSSFVTSFANTALIFLTVVCLPICRNASRTTAKKQSPFPSFSIIEYLLLLENVSIQLFLGDSLYSDVISSLSIWFSSGNNGGEITVASLVKILSPIMSAAATAPVDICVSAMSNFMTSSTTIAFNAVFPRSAVLSILIDGFFVVFCNIRLMYFADANIKILPFSISRPSSSMLLSISLSLISKTPMRDAGESFTIR